jgi:hypothetical protein
MVDGLWQEKQCNLIQFRVTGSPCEYYRCNRATHRQKKKGWPTTLKLAFSTDMHFKAGSFPILHTLHYIKPPHTVILLPHIIDSKHFQLDEATIYGLHFCNLNCPAVLTPG